MDISEIKIIYQNRSKPTQQISSSEDSYKVFLEHFDQDTIELQEFFKILYLNRANKVLGIYHHTTGGITGTVADIKLIFGTALKVVASSIIVAHNHPSSNLNPSQADKNLTKKMVEAGKLLDVQMLDHIIVTKDGYYSFADEGFI